MPLQLHDSAPMPASRGQCQAIDLIDKISLIEAHWQPRVVAEMNNYQFKVVKLKGDFVWHVHSETDETFVVLEGELRIDVRQESHDNGASILLRPGQMAVIPQGMEHRPCAPSEVKLLLIEPRGVVNTGDHTPSERTVPNDLWV